MNEVASDEEKPLCVNCHIELTRLVATADGGVQVVARPVILEEPFIAPVPGRGRKPKRSKRRRKTEKATATFDPAASVFNVGHSMASPQVPPVTPPYGTPVAPPIAQAPPVAPVALVAPVVDEGMEATVMHGAMPRVAATWALQFETGEVVPLTSDHVVVGRHPMASDEATPVTLPDPTRKLSRTHARLRRDATRDVWTIEDLNSGNGVATVSSDTGALAYATPGVAVDATEYLLIGTLRTRLHRVTDERHSQATLDVAS